MMRRFAALFLSLALTLASLSLAAARGASHDIGAEIAICTGVGMVTISLGPDGQPVETSDACPDGTSIFAASFGLPAAPAPRVLLVATVEPPPGRAPAPAPALSASARDPPVRS